MLFDGEPSPQGLGAHSVGTEHTSEEVALISAYNTAAAGLQTGLIETTGAVGLSVQGVVDAVDAVEALAGDGSFNLTNPGAILDVTGPFATLLLSLPMSNQLDFDIEAALAAVTAPCAAGGIISDLGTAASDICSTLDTSLETTLNIINGIPGQITSLFQGTLTFATNATNTFINDANTSLDAVCDPLNSFISGVNAFSLGAITVPEIKTPSVFFSPAFQIPSLPGTSVPGLNIHLFHFEECAFGVCVHTGIHESTPTITLTNPISFPFIPEISVPEKVLVNPTTLLPLIQPFSFASVSCPTIQTIPAPVF